MKLLSKTTFNSAFVDKINYQNQTLTDLRIISWKIVVLYKIYKEIGSSEYFWQRLYVVNILQMN
jgi:hypothetical protein